ncbi:hypothetical protein K402DRAFT_179137 [Aulographum hederae CBS 113979]|uniref:Uncharacterized protein n=1 Tax=Aulographum hederae CBS 113979 TaxID=1176131 RepID=A0A6G1GQT2_9PEZI|nr:hypothetical protein K402DRAFT_179137 [Aulographum hederae CBS 113979]
MLLRKMESHEEKLCTRDRGPRFYVTGDASNLPLTRGHHSQKCEGYRPGYFRKRKPSWTRLGSTTSSTKHKRVILLKFFHHPSSTSITMTTPPAKTHSGPLGPLGPIVSGLSHLSLNPRFPCDICLKKKPEGKFPATLYTPGCKHIASVCKERVQSYITNKQDNDDDLEIPCPATGCHEIMRQRDILHHCSVEQAYRHMHRVQWRILKKRSKLHALRKLQMRLRPNLRQQQARRPNYDMRPLRRENMSPLRSGRTQGRNLRGA